MRGPVFAFRRLDRADFPVLAAWFAEKVVARWWNQDLSMDAVAAKYNPRIDGNEPTMMWILEIDGEPAGLFQHYLHRDYPAHDAAVGIPNAVGIDYLLSDPYRGRGLGGMAIRAFADLALAHVADADVCVATPTQDNVASWRALEKAGFRRRGPCQPPEEPPAWIYARPRESVQPATAT